MSRKANAAEILRSAQKDVHFINYIFSVIADVGQKFTGQSFWIKHQQLVEAIIEFLYLSTTTVSLYQTLGEEYTGILLLNDVKNIPSFYKRMGMSLLQSFGPLTLKLVLNKIENSFHNGFLSSFLRKELNEIIVKYIPVLTYTVKSLQHAHLALFYVTGIYYHVAKRISKLQYALVYKWMGDDNTKKSFRVLGALLLCHTVLSFLLQLFWKATQEEIKPKKEVICAENMCSLCLYRRKYSSAILCGHVFCWNCIHKSLQRNLNCPICRNPTLQRDVIPLINYD